MTVNILLVGNQKGYIPVILFHYILLSCVKRFCIQNRSTIQQERFSYRTKQKKLFFVEANIVNIVIKVSMYIADLEYYLVQVHGAHGNDFATNVITFVINNSASSQYNRKNNCYYQLKGLPMILETVLLLQRKNLVLTLTKQKQIFD